MDLPTWCFRSSLTGFNLLESHLAASTGFLILLPAHMSNSWMILWSPKLHFNHSISGWDHHQGDHHWALLFHHHHLSGWLLIMAVMLIRVSIFSLVALQVCVKVMQRSCHSNLELESCFHKVWSFATFSQEKLQTKSGNVITNFTLGSISKSWYSPPFSDKNGVWPWIQRWCDFAKWGLAWLAVDWTLSLAKSPRPCSPGALPGCSKTLLKHHQDYLALTTTRRS